MCRKTVKPLPHECWRIRMRAVPPAVLVFWLLVPFAAHPSGSATAQTEGASEIRKVTWPDIVRLVNEHPRLAASRLSVVAGQAAVDAAGAVPNPSLHIALGKGDARDGTRTELERGLELTLPLGWIAQRDYRMAVAKAELDATQNEAESLRRDVLLQLRVLFWNVADDQARVDALRALENQTAALVHSVQRRVEKGEARPVEQTRIEVELERVRSDLAASEISLRANREQLQLWIGGGPELLVEADLFTIPHLPDLETALANARANHPSIKAARAKVAARAAEVGVEKRARVPSLALKAFAEEEVDRRAYGGAISVDVPLWNWNAGGIAQARAQLAAGKKLLEAQAREIESSVIESHGACLAASQAAAGLQDRILPRSEAAAVTMERTYQLGEASLFEAIDARRVLAETRRQYLAALAQAQIDCSRFKILVGEEENQ